MKGKHFEGYKLPEYSKTLRDISNQLEYQLSNKDNIDYLTLYYLIEYLRALNIYTDFEIDTIVKKEFKEME